VDCELPWTRRGWRMVELWRVNGGRWMAVYCSAAGATPAGRAGQASRSHGHGPGLARTYLCNSLDSLTRRRSRRSAHESITEQIVTTPTRQVTTRPGTESPNASDALLFPIHSVVVLPIRLQATIWLYKPIKSIKSKRENNYWPSQFH